MQRLLATLCALAIAVHTLPAFARPLPKIRYPVVMSDPELAAARAGFVAPGGLQIDIRIQLDTLVNGMLVLRSVLNPEAPLTNGLQIFAPSTPSSATSTSPAAASTVPLATPVTVGFNRSTGVTIGVPAAAPQIQVSRVAEIDAPDDTAGVALAVTPNGAPVIVSGATVRIVSTASGALVTYDSADLQIRQALGAGAVTAVGNTANDRSIDSVTRLGISLPNGSALNVGSTQARIADTALRSTVGLLR